MVSNTRRSVTCRLKKDSDSDLLDRDGWLENSVNKPSAPKGLTEFKMTELVDPMNVLANEKYINLETYKKNGEVVQTPVWFIEKDGLIYVHTAQKTWKVKRLRRNPEVRIATSSFRGKPKGNWLRGEARFADGSETDQILRVFDKKYGLTGRLIIFIEKLISGKRILISIKLKDQNQTTGSPPDTYLPTPARLTVG